jgi:phenylalanyl-tRNA synthetase beta chain
MKIPLQWLREWVDVPWPAADLGARLTMAGFELEALEAAAPAFRGVVVGEIVSAEHHPQADKLQVCRVAIGGGETVQIVCGAANARAGIKSALARVGAELPGGMAIHSARLRGIESSGMLCSARELGLADSSEGILELPAELPTGADLRAALTLDDPILDLAITPNRGDAMSVLGIAREVAALADRPLRGPAPPRIPASTELRHAVHLDAPAACPRFVGRVISGVDNRRASPWWLRERLRRAGQRSISPVVDVSNLVMLELGQPMHAYDRGKLAGDIRVRHAADGETCVLLDGREVPLEHDVLVIADGAGPVGLAGIMGGQRTAVSADTREVFLEVAWFAPDAIAGRGRRYGLTTEAGQRFERGVDPALPLRAIERATELLLAVAGGVAGPVVVTEHAAALPPLRRVRLRRSQIRRLLGLELEAARVRGLLESLGMSVEERGDGWDVTAPSHRFDIAIERDLIEELARIVGYEQIPEVDATLAQRFRAMPEREPREQRILDLLAARGYQEAIHFAFADPALQSRLAPESRRPLQLANPIASDLAVMRVSLWPGLVRSVLENQRRQQERVRLFEHGVVFVGEAGDQERARLAGVVAGSRWPEQWGVSSEIAEYYDARADLEALFSVTGELDSFEFVPESSAPACLHPGRCAQIRRRGEPVGWLGEMHPELVRALGLTYAPVLWEVDWHDALHVQTPVYRPVSRQPQVRRDLAVVVDENVPFSAIHERVTLSASALLREIRLFDVYRGKGVENGRKSVAIGLIFQDDSRTLTDEDADRLVAAICADLAASLRAKIRE